MGGDLSFISTELIMQLQFGGRVMNSIQSPAKLQLANLVKLVPLIDAFLKLNSDKLGIEEFWSILGSVFPLEYNWRGYQFVSVYLFSIEFVVLLFSPNSETGVHDHYSLINPNLVLFGEIKHTIFNIRNGKPRIVEEYLLKAGQVKWLVKYQIHSINVSTSTPALMLNIHYPVRNT